MTRQDELNDRVWAACEAFRGDMHFTLCRDHALALIFLKYISDVWHNCPPQMDAPPGSVAKARFYLPRVDGMDPSAAREADLFCDDDIYGGPPEGSLAAAPGPDVFLADIYNLNIRRTAAHIGILLTRTLAALEQHNQAALGGLFHHLVFHTEAVLGSGPEPDARLRNFLSALAFLELRANMRAYPALFLFLIERFALEDAATPETPRQIARLLHHLVKPRQGEHLADPAAGCGSLLLASSGHGVPLVLAGQEAAHHLWAIARMNLLIHEQDEAILKQGDSLSKPLLLHGAQLQQFDVVLTWPPQRDGPWIKGKKRPDTWGRFQRGMPNARGAELAWLSHCLAITRPACGRLAIITPRKTLYCGAPDGQIRRSLIEENLLDTVIFLPPNVLPHARQPMAVCLFDRSREPGGARAHARDVLLIDAGAGQEPNKRLCLPDASQIDEIIANVNARQTQGPRCYLASFDEIAANDFDLSMPRYLLARTPHKPRDLPRERQEIEQLEETLLQLQRRLQQELAVMGS